MQDAGIGWGKAIQHGTGDFGGFGGGVTGQHDTCIGHMRPQPRQIRTILAARRQNLAQMGKECRGRKRVQPLPEEHNGWMKVGNLFPL